MALECDGFGPYLAFGGLVAEEEGGVVGYMLYHRGSDTRGSDTDAACRLLVVADLFVTHAGRGRGIGKALMQQARAVARAQGAQRLIWTAYRPNTLARQFYGRIGSRYLNDHDQMYLDV